MQLPDKQIKSIVLVGTFNPTIFQPAWFVGQNLIGETEGINAEINIIHSDVVNFRLEWCNLEVTRERVVVTTTQESAFERIRDLTIGTFRLLAHTPVSMLGINLEMHFRMKSVEDWHSFGHQLAPKEPFWNETLKNPGTLNVSIHGERPDKYFGRIMVDVKPSDKVLHGVSFRINDHFEIEDKKHIIGCDHIINILEEEWNNSQERASNIIANTLGKIGY